LRKKRCLSIKRQISNFHAAFFSTENVHNLAAIGIITPTAMIDLHFFAKTKTGLVAGALVF